VFWWKGSETDIKHLSFTSGDLSLDFGICDLDFHFLALTLQQRPTKNAPIKKKPVS